MSQSSSILWDNLESLKNNPHLVEKLTRANREWQNTLADIKKRGTDTNILVTGVQNSGKSTLCNALIDDYDNATFEIGDCEKTLTVKSEKNARTGALVTDTPGFGTNASAIQEFERLWRGADTLIYVISVLGGSIADNDICLANLRKIRDESCNRDNGICVVCAKMGDSDNAEEIFAKNREIVNGILGESAPMFLIDSSWYQEAKKNDDRRLCEASGIPPLLEWLEERAKTPNKSEQIFAEAKKAWLQCLNEARYHVQSEIARAEAKKENSIRDLLNVWRGFFEHLKSLWKKCREYAG